MVYNFKTGLGKSFKNVLTTYGAPALLYLINGITEWMPADQAVLVAPIIGFITYVVKNFIKNK